MKIIHHHIKNNIIKSSIFIIAIISVGIILFSCNKEELPQTKTELLTNHAWIAVSKIISPSYQIGGIIISDLMVLDSDEVKNYSFKYNLDGTVIHYNKSNQMFFQTNWSFNSDETQIEFNPAIILSYPSVGNYELTTITIESITKDQMKLTTPYLFEGVNYIITTTFSPKL